ncbi:SDR family NAD(P)-dependent oxidoreductase [Flavihumibacter petaseus]|uniref:Putative oxidoreductase n=1 Tax=Flavihumibacter petaseus NBRC 106054 TaxID=1220578 RepID=A0A0E9N157_9BACT|nr:SDR family oxidoreductase [Flavihumibacter petaseus]GAO43085.1 putative oxidoreductase [Flavihumibacter petaseus NBRC 106054]
MEAGKTYTLITGGSAGIGLELARLFARDGHNLILVARTQSDLDAAKNELTAQGVDVVTIAKDLFDPDAPFELYQEVNDQYIVEILVNDAGQGEYGLFKDTDIDRELDIIQLNICSLVTLTKLFLPNMLERGEGSILNVSSIAGKTPGPWQSVYHGTKAFVQSFTEALRSELKEEGIVVTALLPGATDTDFFNKANMEDSKAVQDKDKLSDPAKVAKDGYDALLADKDKVISGFKNKMMMAAANVMPESNVADMMKKQQEPVSKDKQ